MKRTLQEAIAATYDIIKARPIFGARHDLFREEESANREGETDVFNGRWERGWSVSASLRIKRCAADAKKEGIIWVLETEIGWSCSKYSIVSAKAATDLHSEVINLACLIETAWAEYRVPKTP